MTKRSLEFSRRAFVAGVVILPQAMYAAPWLDPEHHFKAALSELALPISSARLDVLKFEQHFADGGSQVDTTVQMRWPDGLHRHRFKAQSATVEGAIATLIDQVAASFAART